MKTISRIDRILRSLPGMAIVIGLCGGGICVEAQTNRWTSPVITMLSSALNSPGTFNMNGTVNQGFFSGVTASNLYIGGVYNLTNGTLNVMSNEILGGLPSPSVFNEEGGFHYANQLLIGA